MFLNTGLAGASHYRRLPGIGLKHRDFPGQKRGS